MKLSKGQLEALWTSAGGTPGSAHLAAAIALAESGGDSNATNHNTDGSTDRGLWQINTVHGSQSTYSIPGNVRAAISISSNGHDWSPWTTYKTGAYQQFMSGATGATSLPAGMHNTGILELVPGFGGPSAKAFEKDLKSAIPGAGTLLEGANSLNPFSSLTTFFGDLQKVFEPAFWIRVGKVLLGVFLLLTGLLGMANVPGPVEVAGKAKGVAIAAGAL